MRTFVVKSGQTLKEISAELTDGRVTKAQADAALKSIRFLNPNIGTGKLKAGTVVVIPAVPGIKTGPTRAAKEDPVGIVTDQFQRSARETLANVVAAIKTRDAERSEIAAAFKTDGFKRALESNKELGAKADLARKALAEDEAADKETAGSFETLLSQAKDALAGLEKLL